MKLLMSTTLTSTSRTGRTYMFCLRKVTGTFFWKQILSLPHLQKRHPIGKSPRTLVRLLFTYHPDLEFEDLQAEKFAAERGRWNRDWNRLKSIEDENEDEDEDEDHDDDDDDYDKDYIICYISLFPEFDAASVQCEEGHWGKTRFWPTTAGLHLDIYIYAWFLMIHWLCQ